MQQATLDMAECYSTQDHLITGRPRHAHDESLTAVSILLLDQTCPDFIPSRHHLAYAYNYDNYLLMNDITLLSRPSDSFL